MTGVIDKLLELLFEALKAEQRYPKFVVSNSTAALCIWPIGHGQQKIATIPWNGSMLEVRMDVETEKAAEDFGPGMITYYEPWNQYRVSNLTPENFAANKTKLLNLLRAAIRDHGHVPPRSYQERP